MPRGGGAGRPRGVHWKWNRKRGGLEGPQNGTEEPSKRQIAFIKVDILQEAVPLPQTPLSPRRKKEETPRARALFVRLSTVAACTTGPRCPRRVWPAACVRGRDPQRSRPALHAPTSPPEAGGTRWEPAEGARQRVSSECAAVTGVSVRAGLCTSVVRASSHCGPRSLLRARTGPLQLPRAMILWKQKLKVRRNNGGPTGCNLGQARTC